MKMPNLNDYVNSGVGMAQGGASMASAISSKNVGGAIQAGAGIIQSGANMLPEGRGTTALKGAAGGAASGAAMGSAAGPWGTAIGAVAGAVVGFLSGWFSKKRKSYKDLVHSAAEIQESHRALVATCRQLLLELELPPGTMVKTGYGMMPVEKVKQQAIKKGLYQGWKQMAELPPDFDALKYLTDPMVRREVLQRLAKQGTTGITDADLIALGKKFGGSGQLFGEYDRYGRPKFYHGPNNRMMRVHYYLMRGSPFLLALNDVRQEGKANAERVKAIKGGYPMPPNLDPERTKRVHSYLIPGSEFLMQFNDVREQGKVNAARIKALKASGAIKSSPQAQTAPKKTITAGKAMFGAGVAALLWFL
jgi:hypothetical protein